MELFLRYWGKTSKDDCYHLLPYHCLDVAAVGSLLLAHGNDLCRRLASNLGIEPVSLRRWFTFCLSLHDIGKFATAFQGQVPNLSKFLVPFNPRMPYTERHDTLGFMLWRDFLTSKWFRQGGLGFEPEQRQLREILRAFDPWLEIVTGHHGIPPKGSIIRHQDFFTEQDELSAFQYCMTVADLFLGNLDLSFLADKSFKKRLKGQSWILAGLVVLADWLGSSLKASDYCKTSKELNQYWEKHALPIAVQIIKKADLSPAIVSSFSGTNHLFPFIHELTPLQQWVTATEFSDSPHLFILEDVTGSGKTEAALTLAHRLMAEGLANGVYVALPTMATANAMYERLGKAYRRLFAGSEKPSLVLAHGARHLSENFRASIGLTESLEKEKKYAPDEESGETYCNAWLADSRKKALLADIGVGTIDQALLGVLPAKHQSLRLLGLSRKVLVVDEVHAYDPYMNQLLQTLLEAHARGGGSAILLSATLPQLMREKYAQAFCIGADLKMPELNLSPQYPLVTQIPSPREPESHVATRRQTVRAVSVVMLTEIDQVEKVVRQSRDKGQCICWIRNTVGDARKAYDLLVDQSWIDGERLSLFHSRFAMVDRQRVETETLKFFGKDSCAEKRRGRVLVATQVVEQSLDLDFDVLISDIAPMDLLIQRSGRLHRHIRDADGNPLKEYDAVDGRGVPVLYVYGPGITEAPETDWLEAVLPGTQAIYRHVGHIWLTQKRLVEAGKIETPGNSRWLIEGVYDDVRQDEIPEALRNLSFDAEGKDSGKRGMARINALNLTKGYTRASSEDINGWDEEVRIPTRLSDETVTVALARIDHGVLRPYAKKTEFAWEMSMFSLPKKEWRAVSQKIPDELAAAIAQLKETERVLKWVEVLPLTAEIESCYDSRMGWELNREGSDESD